MTQQFSLQKCTLENRSIFRKSNGLQNLLSTKNSNVNPMQVFCIGKSHRLLVRDWKYETHPKEASSEILLEGPHRYRCPVCTSLWQVLWVFCSQFSSCAWDRRLPSPTAPGWLEMTANWCLLGTVINIIYPSICPRRRDNSHLCNLHLLPKLPRGPEPLARGGTYLTRHHSWVLFNPHISLTHFLQATFSCAWILLLVMVSGETQPKGTLAVTLAPW